MSTTIAGLQMSFSDTGTGIPIVLLHAFPTDRRMWDGQQDLAQSYRVITPDLPGFGESQPADSLTMSFLADQTARLLQSIAAVPCVLGGCSMGGYVALEYARTRPNDLLGLILIDTRAEGETPAGRDARNKMIDLAASSGTRPVAEQMLTRMMTDSARQRRPQVAQKLLDIMLDCPAATIQQAVAAMRDRMDQTENLASIAVPTLIMVGDDDSITPPATAEAMHEKIRRSRLTRVPDAGHLSPLEQPAAVNAAIAEFIKTLN